jgi:GTP-binding protein
MTLIPEDLEAGRLLFAAECQFVWGTDRLEQLPEASLPEVTFSGRSNVGKSSLINALTGRNALARTSDTPGRTQQLNFFNLGERLMLVDVPGYGYAKESKTKVEAWTELVRRYLKGRVPLRRVCLLIDSRHGPKPVDDAMMRLLDGAAVPFQVVLTKADKLTPKAEAAVRAATALALKSHPAAFPEPHLTSADSGLGIPELRASLAELAEPGR